MSTDNETIEDKQSKARRFHEGQGRTPGARPNIFNIVQQRMPKLSSILGNHTMTVSLKYSIQCNCWLRYLLTVCFYLKSLHKTTEFPIYIFNYHKNFVSFKLLKKLKPKYCLLLLNINLLYFLHFVEFIHHRSLVDIPEEKYICGVRLDMQLRRPQLM